MNTLINEKQTDALVAPEWLSDSYAAAVTSATNASANDVKIKNILVPIRPSKSSDRALKYAAWLAGQFGCKIIILHAVAPGSSAITPLELQERVSRDFGIAPAQIRAIIIRQGITDFSPVTIAAGNEHADLIVIPGDFYRQPVRFWQSAKIDKLIHHAPCPVLILGDKSFQPISCERH